MTTPSQSHLVMTGDIQSRVAALEVQVQHVIQNQDKYDEKWDTVNNKLDDLLALRQKGIGAFWLASALVGSGILTIFSYALDMFRHAS